MRTIKLIVILFLLTTLVGCGNDEQVYEKVEYEDVNDLIINLTLINLSSPTTVKIVR